jgi:hypothetical protein
MINGPTADFVTSTLSGAITAIATSATIGTGLNLAAENGILQLDYDSIIAVGTDDGPETIQYATYNSTTGALTGMTRGMAGTTGVAHNNGSTVSCGPSALHFQVDPSWIPSNDTWAYASASTITIPAGGATKYAIGDWIKYTQAATEKYAHVTVVADTTLTVSGTVANSAISANYYSRAQSPVGIGKMTPGYAEITSTFTSATTAGADVTGLSKAVTVPAGGRYIRVTACLPSYYSTATGAIELYAYIKEGATILQTAKVTAAGTQYKTSLQFSYVVAATAGAHTYKVAIGAGAAGTMTVEAQTTPPATLPHILIEEI